MPYIVKVKGEIVGGSYRHWCKCADCGQWVDAWARNIREGWRVNA